MRHTNDQMYQVIHVIGCGGYSVVNVTPNVMQSVSFVQCDNRPSCSTRRIISGTKTGTTTFTDTLSTNFHLRRSRRGKTSSMLKNQEFGRIAERKEKEQDR
jgi:hypothetical protein